MKYKLTIYAVLGLMLLAGPLQGAGSKVQVQPKQPGTLNVKLGTASWYGEEHRGRLMANRQRFNPDRLTCASWFHPLGTRLVITRTDGIPGSVEVEVTDRGPHRRFVRQGRVIDLSRAAFERLEGLEMGLLSVRISPVQGPRVNRGTTEKSPDAKPQLAARAWPGLLREGNMAPNQDIHDAPLPASRRSPL